jgi:hypothetical protein
LTEALLHHHTIDVLKQNHPICLDAFFSQLLKSLLDGVYTSEVMVGDRWIGLASGSSLTLIAIYANPD